MPVSGRTIPIASVSDPAIRAYANVRDRDLTRAREGGVFVAEGENVVRVLCGRGRFVVQSLFLSERRVAAMQDVIDALPETIPVYVAPQSVMDAIIGFPIHRGVLALGERGPVVDPASLLAGVPEGLVVGLVGLTNHDNVGGIFRNAAAFRVRAILHDAATCDPLYRKAVRVSVGGALIVPFARAETPEAMLEALESAGYQLLGLTPGGSETLADVPPSPRRALLFGTEGDGLPESILKRVHRVRIPMADTIDSLNVSVASGVALYEITRPAS